MEPVDLVLAKHATKLAQLSKTIQVSSATINGLLEAIEERLRVLQLGVEAYVQSSQDWRYGYGKVLGHKWCLFNECRVYIQHEPPYWKRVAIRNCTRQEKVRCLLNLPQILDVLVENSQKLAKELDDANREVSAFLEQMHT